MNDSNNISIHKMIKPKKKEEKNKKDDKKDDFERYEPFFWLVVPAASNIQDLLKATTANAA